jgi:hypothetical protein
VETLLAMLFNLAMSSAIHGRLLTFGAPRDNALQLIFDLADKLVMTRSELA